MTQQIQVSNGVEHLVLDEFIAIAQPFAIQHAVFVEHHRIIEAAAERQPIFTKPFDFLHETESSRARHFAHIGIFGKVDSHFLPGTINRRVVEDNRERQPESLMRLEARPFITGTIGLAHLDRALDTDEFLGRRLLLDPGRLDQEDERRCRAIKNRHFGRIQIDKGVVDAKPGKG